MSTRTSTILVLAAFATSVVGCGKPAENAVPGAAVAPPWTAPPSTVDAERGGDSAAPTGPSRRAPNAQAPTTCAQRISAAADKLQAILDANQTCNQDSDCVSVGFGATCFDSCSRTIAASGGAAYTKAVQDANANECAAYAAAGCPRPVIPPCAPPLPPTCRAGKCR